MSIDFDYQGVPHTLDPWRASRDRYDSMAYRRVGQSGLILPAISLGLWYNFGDNRPFDVQREVLRHAFDKGITHFDLANNYGPPYGSAEENFGRMMRTDFRPYRHELILSTKAGWDMWPGPQGQRVRQADSPIMRTTRRALRRRAFSHSVLRAQPSWSGFLFGRAAKVGRYTRRVLTSTCLCSEPLVPQDY